MLRGLDPRLGLGLAPTLDLRLRPGLVPLFEPTTVTPTFDPEVVSPVLPAVDWGLVVGVVDVAAAEV